MATIYYDKDASLEPLRGKTVAVIGYGSQGHAHAQNLRDSGVSVVVGLYRGSPSWAKAEGDGFRVATVGDAAAKADLVAMLAPDHVQRSIYEQEIGPVLRPGATLLFAHGFNIHFGQIVPAPTVDVAMIAPKAPGHRMRELFVEGVGVPGLLAVHQNVTGHAKETALAYGRAVGCTKAGVIETTFKEETETDLFGEQTVLCGGISSLIKTGFDILVEAGYQPEIAYFECLHEMKLIVDLMYEGGLSYMRYSVSDTAEYGDYSRGHRVISDRVRAEMKRILGEVQDGTFAREWVSENQAGRPNFKEQRKQEQAHPIEEVGRRLRAMMPRRSGRRNGRACTPLSPHRPSTWPASCGCLPTRCWRRRSGRWRTPGPWSAKSSSAQKTPPGRTSISCAACLKRPSAPALPSSTSPIPSATRCRRSLAHWCGHCASVCRGWTALPSASTATTTWVSPPPTPWRV